MLDEFVMCIRGFEAGIVALHIHLPTTSTTDFPEIQEPDLEGQHTGCVDEIARHFTGEVPVQKVKTEAWGVHRRANEVLSQRQFCRAMRALPIAALQLAAPRTGAWVDLCSSGRWSWWRAWRWPPFWLPPPASTECAARTSRTATAVWPPARAGGWAGRASALADHGRRHGACRGTGGAHACRTRRWRGLAASVGARRPHTPRRSLRSVVGRTVFHCRAVCRRAPVASACSFP